VGRVPPKADLPTSVNGQTAHDAFPPDLHER
jgi:hypothetical protein